MSAPAGCFCSIMTAPAACLTCTCPDCGQVGRFGAPIVHAAPCGATGGGPKDETV